MNSESSQTALDAGDRSFSKKPERFRKQFRPGDRATRDHEAAALAKAKGPLVPPVLAQGEDAGGPWLELANCGDVDLRQLIASSGPLPSDAALTLASSCAQALLQVHQRGVVHGDVKPANFLLDNTGKLGIVDFENAVWREGERIRRPVRKGFTGGTHGYAPVQARLGHVPDPSFDVFGFGATIHFILVGRRPPLHEDGSFDERLLQRLRPTLAPSLGKLIHDCLAREAEARPKIEELPRRIEQLTVPTHPDIEFEVALLEGRSADPELGQAQERVIALRSHWGQRLDRILQEIPISEIDQPIEDRLDAAERFCRAAALCLRFAPLLPRLRERLARAQIKIPQLLLILPGEAKRLLGTGQLTSSSELATRAKKLATLLAEIPLERQDAAEILASVLRAAESIQRHVEAEEPKQRELWQQLETAESQLDLGRAREFLQELQERYSGTTPFTTAARDRLHRLGWLLERLSGGRPQVERAAQLLSNHACPELLRLFTRIEENLGRDRIERQEINLDLVARVLGELLESHPRLDLNGARRELKQLRLGLSQRVIQLLDSMDTRLHSDPVPIRPLIQDLEEIDRILLLGALIDTRDASRSALVDRLERLRLRVEEISEQGQRLMQGAKDQFDHGRLTTALFDLERALKATEREGAGEEAKDSQLGIREELERIRHLREEVQAATRRNRELAEMHHRLTAQGQESLDARQRLQEERGELLQFLIEHGSRAFAPRYRTELFDLGLTTARERAESGEIAYLHEQSPEAQKRIAQELLQLLEKTRSELAIPKDGPLATIEDRWRSYYERAAGDARDLREQAEREARRKLQLLLSAALLLLAAGVAAWALLG